MTLTVTDEEPKDDMSLTMGERNERDENGEMPTVARRREEGALDKGMKLMKN